MKCGASPFSRCTVYQNTNDNHFYITIETARNWKKTKIEISAFLLNSKHFEFQFSSIQHKFLAFLQKRFFHWNFSFKTIFFCEWGASASALARARQGPHPHSQKKIHFEKYDFQWKNASFQRNQGNSRLI